jgi:hypothetical protein
MPWKRLRKAVMILYRQITSDNYILYLAPSIRSRVKPLYRDTGIAYVTMSVIHIDKIAEKSSKVHR